MNVLRRSVPWCVAVTLLCTAPRSEASSLVVGGFNAARGGDMNLVTGSFMCDMRSTILETFPCTEFTSTGTLTSAYLSTVDVVVLSSARTGSAAITPLTAAEQAALRAFVENGGGAILLVDNSTFAGGATDLANESLIDPFGLDVTGTLSGTQPATVIAAHTIVNGPHGALSSYNTFWTGWFNTLGPYAQSVARLNFNSQSCLAVIEPSALAPGSGGVVLASDTAPWVILFSDLTRPIVKNSIEFAGGHAPVCDPPASTLVIGGFDAARGGSISMASGSLVCDMRVAILDTFPCVQLTETNVLTSAYLNTVDVVVLSSGTSGSSVITPLTAAEQAALRSFVESGGSAILLVDNNTSAGAASEPANESLIDPFGLDVTGTLTGTQAATVTASHAVVNGPYGSVSSYTTSYPGWFDNLGPYAQPLARLNFNSQTCLAVIERSALAPGSGAVVLASDTSSPWIFLSLQALPLVQNSVHFTGGPGACDGTAPVVMCPGAITQQCTSAGGAAVSYSVSVTDDSDPNPVVVCEPASGSVFPVGQHVVTCVATDAAGNRSTCSFEVTVTPGPACDTTAPEIVCPGDLTLECTSTDGAVATFTVSATDDFDPSPVVASEPASGTVFSIGQHTVTFFATDAAGNQSSCTFQVTVGAGVGALAGRVTANCPEPGTPLLGVRVDAYVVGTGMLAAGSWTDEGGNFAIPDLPSGSYVVTVITPLGYTVPDAELPADIRCSETTRTDFALDCLEIAQAQRSIGYWKHQVGVATGGRGNAEVDASTLCGYLDLIEAHFNNNALNPVEVYQPPAGGACDDKLGMARDLLNLRGNASMITRARQQLMALLLNVASQRLGLGHPISADGRTVAQAITYCDNLIDMPAGDHERAKSIADAINNGIQVAAGLIPDTTPDIAYKGTSVSPPARFALQQNRPNPFNPSTTIEFALPVSSTYRLAIFDAAGRTVRGFAGEADAGTVRIHWEGTDHSGRPVGSGLYFYRLEAGPFVATKKMILAR